MTSLFESAGRQAGAPRPLADELRPKTIGEVVGQDHLLGASGIIRRMLDGGRLGSLILWGPPGTGKTTIARLLADESGLEFLQMSAIFSGVQDLRKAFDTAKAARQHGQGTLLFVDEIHRFNKAQQDGFLPHVEDGTITLVGATTENPSFELNAALLSRMQVLVLERLDMGAMEQLLARAENHFGRSAPLRDTARDALFAMADGDGRYLLNIVEELFASVAGGDDALDAAALGALVQRRAPQYDKSRDEHYNLISALHKSVRGSDPHAALYWLARMLAGGEDPLFLARRLVRMAIEDIGLGDPDALVQANAAKDAYHFLGSPEGELALAQATLYLATAPKSNAAHAAFKKAQALARQTGSVAPPKIILNAPTRLMKDQGYGADYLYDHDQEDGFSGQNYFPGEMERPLLYAPLERGFEREIRRRLDYWERLRKERTQGCGS